MVEAGAAVDSEDLEKRCVENAIDYALLTTDTPFEEALVRYLGKRGRMG